MGSWTLNLNVISPPAGQQQEAAEEHRSRGTEESKVRGGQKESKQALDLAGRRSRPNFRARPTSASSKVASKLPTGPTNICARPKPKNRTTASRGKRCGSVRIITMRIYALVSSWSPDSGSGLFSKLAACSAASLGLGHDRTAGARGAEPETPERGSKHTLTPC